MAGPQQLDLILSRLSVTPGDVEPLRRFVQREVRDRTAESFTRFMNDLNRRIFDLVNSSATPDKIAGITVIDNLIDVQCEENETKIIRFANYLRMAVSSSDLAIVEMAAAALGHLARAGGDLTPDFVEFEVKRALEWLEGDRYEHRRLAAVLVLRQLADNVPTLFNQHVSTFVNHVWVALHDPLLNIRQAAALALRAALQVIRMRGVRWRVQWYARVWSEAKKGLSLANPDTIHGSLLTIQELLRIDDDFMIARYKEACDITLSFRDHRTTVVREAVLQTLPLLAQYCTDAFVRAYMDPALDHLVDTLTAPATALALRDLAFRALGDVAVSIGDKIRPRLPTVVQLIRTSLSAKANRRHPACVSCLTCLGAVAAAVGPALLPEVAAPTTTAAAPGVSTEAAAPPPPTLLELAFRPGLCEPLIGALTSIVEHIPQLLDPVQTRLMACLLSILAVDWRQPAAQLRRTSSLYSTGNLFDHIEVPVEHGGSTAISSSSSGTTELSADLLCLALQTLGSFNLTSVDLFSFLRDVLVDYLEYDNPRIRRQACVTCARLLLRHTGGADGVMAHRPQVLTVASVMERLLRVGIADPIAEVRLAVLQNLDPSFDRFLAQSENLQSLFIALNDEVLSIRMAATSVIGRLAQRNPAYVMPSLRKTLIQLLTELQLASEGRAREDSCTLLAQLLQAAQHLIAPYAGPILQVLVPKLKDPDPGVASCVLATLGQLAAVGGPDMQQHLERLMPLVVEALQDRSSALKRQVALRTLGQLASSTGAVIQPYHDYLQLMPALLDSLKSEEAAWTVRREALRTIGVLGALDPFRQWQIQSQLNCQSSEEIAETEVTLQDAASSNDDFYPTVAIEALMRILVKPTLAQHHSMVTQAVMFIFKSLGIDGVHFLPQIVPAFLSVLKTTNDEGMREVLFQQIGVLVVIVQQHIRNFLEPIFQSIYEHWKEAALLPATLALIEEISLALKDEFKVFVPDVLPHLLELLSRRSMAVSAAAAPLSAAVHALEILAPNLLDYFFLVIPPLIKLSADVDVVLSVRLQCIRALAALVHTPLNQLNSYASRIIHPLVRLLNADGTPPELRAALLDLLCSLLIQLGKDFTIFVPLISKVLSKHSLPATRYFSLLNAVLNPITASASKLSLVDAQTARFAPESAASAAMGGAAPVALEGLGPIKRLHVSQSNLKKAWEASQRSSRDDWVEWLRRLAVELLKESPSPALRSCSALAQKHHALAQELFNVAFVSCWNELYDQYQDDLVRSLEIAFQSPTAPPQLLQTLLNLAEFMEHDGNPLPITISTLSELAIKCHAFAKALHYKECEFRANATATTSAVEALIAINNQLQQPEAAVGILEYSRVVSASVTADLREEWYEKLQRWGDALHAYERRQLADPVNPEFALGRMRCLNALCEWERLRTLIRDVWWPRTVDHDINIRQRMAFLGVQASWHLGAWAEIAVFIEAMDATGDSLLEVARPPPNETLNYDSTFFHALLAVHEGRHEAARDYIERDRVARSASIGALVGKGYRRAYSEIVRLQQLAELEEVIEYRECQCAARRRMLQTMWTQRLYGCQADVDVWQSLLAVRALVIDASADVATRLKFAALCRKSTPPLLGVSLRTIRSLDADLPVARFAMCKHIWATGQCQDAVRRLRQFVGVLPDHDDAEIGALSASAHRKLALWIQETAQESGTLAAHQDEILALLRKATSYGGANFVKAWQSFALFNYGLTASATASATPYVLSAIHGLFRIVALGGGEASLQNALRILDLLFRYGSVADCYAALKQGTETSSVDTWVQVIPQIIARIHTPAPAIRDLIHQLLCRLGRHHPQALVYPLTVAFKSESEERRQAAQGVLEEMRTHCAALVEQARLVSQELIRVAILWHELWHAALEEASRLFFGARNVPAMLAVLLPLHALMEQGPETLREISFHQQFGRDLQEAGEWCRAYVKTGNEADLSAAWDLYCHVFRHIAKQMATIADVELHRSSPRLLGAYDLALAVPGTYDVAAPDRVVTIAKFAPVLKVIESKQRPRKLTVCGSDGKSYAFLLKGHEDLRQDERVMQLFGLVNVMLRTDRRTATRDLDIKRYSVIPLAPNVGLIEWMPNCDTMHALIKEYRDSRRLLLNIEHRLMTQMAPDYTKLTLMQKIEVFEYALAHTSGMDLHDVLWLKSSNSEAWLDRRTNFTRSLAVASMVGYVLGLGDRHPCNLMIDRVTGKIIHIDFGDCFEVAMTRDKLPEKIPFRLTRMLINAMEVSGIEGNFRSTCQLVMRVLREQKDSLMAVLEAFVHDPLINWRLLKAEVSVPGEAVDVASADDILADQPASLLRRRSVLEDPRSFMPGSSTVKSSFGEIGPDLSENADFLNQRAVAVIERVSNKLTGRDFVAETLDVPEQVQRLIQQATSHENLCQCYIGWCPFW